MDGMIKTPSKIVEKPVAPLVWSKCKRLMCENVLSIEQHVFDTGQKLPHV
jgi:hypothetical protein